MRIRGKFVVLTGLVLLFSVPSVVAGSSGQVVWLDGKRLKVGIDPSAGLPAHIETRGREGSAEWLRGPIRFAVRNEATDTSATMGEARASGKRGNIWVEGGLESLGLQVSQRWASTPSGVTWDFEFSGSGKRAGHEVTFDFPVLRADSQVFTPSNRGVIDVSGRPSYKPPEYAHFGMFDGTSYVLPLVSVFDSKGDRALTIALPPTENIPHLQVEWRDAKILRLTLGHRGMGGGQPSKVRLLLYSHAADYRAVIKAYSDDFPAYFRPTMPRDGLEGAFYYHHIQERPSFEEMARQRVRYMWSSFWFTHVGEYLPPETEWIPYTFANWWRFGEMMSDQKIRAFIQEMNRQGIRVFAFFNVDEYGGPGSYTGRNLHGDSLEIEAWRNGRFADAIVKDAEGNDIPSWEGCKVLNADRRYSFFPHLMEQVRRHLARLPEIEGFLIDRMDWANILDYGHADDLTMVGTKPAANMALPIAAAVQEVCRLSHQKGKRVNINQFYRVEVLRDVDGFCHENDYPPALGYLTPYRPVSAWHFRKPYHGDLLQFEAQLKRRLQFAIFPQMIAHDFPICQQEPDTRAADMLEIYAPLFSTLLGKEQVLLPHSVSVTGASDVNLFINADNNYVAPVTSRTRFLSRRVSVTEAVTVTLRVPDAAEVQWAQIYSADGPPYRAKPVHSGREIKVIATRHGTVSVVVMGRGKEPALDDADAARLGRLRDRLFPFATEGRPRAATPTVQTGSTNLQLWIEGTQVGDWGTVIVGLDGKKVGEISSAFGTFPVEARLSARAPIVTLTVPDEGMWYVPEKVELIAARSGTEGRRVAEWTPEMPATSSLSTRKLHLQLRPVR